MLGVIKKAKFDNGITVSKERAKKVSEWRKNNSGDKGESK